jgi:hypothetical protein
MIRSHIVDWSRCMDRRLCLIEDHIPTLHFVTPLPSCWILKTLVIVQILGRHERESYRYRGSDGILSNSLEDLDIPSVFYFV